MKPRIILSENENPEREPSPLPWQAELDLWPEDRAPGDEPTARATGLSPHAALWALYVQIEEMVDRAIGCGIKAEESDVLLRLASLL